MGLSSIAPVRQDLGVNEKKPAKPSREERLAAKLRENLRRRKAQSRERDTTSRELDATLPKVPPKG
jgi:hypothetical protein